MLGVTFMLVILLGRSCVALERPLEVLHPGLDSDTCDLGVFDQGCP